jgi:hypothetical protein
VSYYFEKYGKVRRLKNLVIDEISSVDRGAGIGARVVLAKRRQWEAEEIAAGRVPPIWEPETFQKEHEMRKADHPFIERVQHLTDMVRKGEIGTGVAELRGKAAHDSSPMFDAYRKDEKGKVLSDHQQWQHFKTYHPVGKAFHEACVTGLRDTQAELSKELGLDHLTDTHEAERRKHPNDGRFDEAGASTTKRAPLTASAVYNAEIDKMARELVARAKKDGISLSLAKAWEAIVTLNEKGIALAALEKFARIGV